MGSVIEKRHRDEPVEEEAAKGARRVGRLSLIVRAMRAGAGGGAVGPSEAETATSSTAAAPAAWWRTAQNRSVRRVVLRTY